MGYYLTYIWDLPYSSTFVKPIQNPQGRKNILYTPMQSDVRKDMERASRVLQSRFAIVQGPIMFWDEKTLERIMTTCIILHNMGRDDELHQVIPYIYL